MNKSFSIYFEGKNNLEVARKFLRGYCYENLIINGADIAQLEIVELFGENGAINECIAVSYIPTMQDVPDVVNYLKKMGFSGSYELLEDNIDGCFATQNLIKKGVF